MVALEGIFCAGRYGRRSCCFVGRWWLARVIGAGFDMAGDIGMGRAHAFLLRYLANSLRGTECSIPTAFLLRLLTQFFVTLVEFRAGFIALFRPLSTISAGWTFSGGDRAVLSMGVISTSFRNCRHVIAWLFEMFVATNS